MGCAAATRLPALLAALCLVLHLILSAQAQLGLGPLSPADQELQYCIDLTRSAGKLPRHSCRPITKKSCSAPTPAALLSTPAQLMHVTWRAIP